MNKRIGRILTATENRDAQKLIHEVYVVEMGWLPQVDNPSSWSVVKDGSDNLMVDRYDANAVRFGVFDKRGDLVATCRLIAPIEGKLEVENYATIPSAYKDRTGLSLELNRLAIKPAFRDAETLLSLATSVFAFLSKNNYARLFLATSVPSPADMCETLGLAHMTPRNLFRYHPSDPQEVSLMWLDCSDKNKLERMIEACVTALER